MSSHENVQRWSLLVIAVIVVAAALHAAQNIAAPLVLGLVVGVVLSPVTDTLDRMGLPQPIAAFGSFMSGILAIVLIVMLLQPVVARTIDAFPTMWREVNSAMYTMKGELRSLSEMSDDVKALMDPGSDVVEEGNPASAVKKAEAPAEGNGESAIPTVEDVIFMAPNIAAQTLTFVGALFFFILTRKEIYAALAKRLSPPGRTNDTALRLRHAERQVSRYVLTITMINLGLGASVGLGMMAIGMPAPLIWGGMAFLLNYFLYVGPSGLAIALLLAGITVFDGGAVLLPMGVYLTMNLIEAQFVTPSLVGRSLSVNPLLVFLALVVFMWLWGPIGAVVAIPLLVWGMVLTADIRDIRRADAEARAAEAGLEPG